jgi:ABC-type transport system involved in multi-copper enzyme maturation permease subunit
MGPVVAIAKLLVKEIVRKKDFYVALILLAVILLYASQLQFYHVENIVRYLLEIGLSLIFILTVILTVSLAARQIPAELQSRTCQVLLAKPVSRTQFLLGKFLGSFAAGAAAFFVFYILFLAVAWSRAGSLSGALALETAYLFLLNLAVLSAMACALSYFLTLSANVTITLIVYFLISLYGEALKSYADTHAWFTGGIARFIYYTFPHFEFFDLRQRFIHNWGAVSPKLLAFLTAYAAVYASLFLFAGWLGFRKRPL